LSSCRNRSVRSGRRTPPPSRRYRGTVKRRYFRGDAAFANPEIYEFLEAEGCGYTIRLPTNPVLQGKIGHLLKRPVGRPPLEVRRYYSSFTYQAQSWKKPHRIVAKVEWHPSELCPASSSPTWRGRPSASSVSTIIAELVSSTSKRQGRDQVDKAVVPLLCRQRGSPSAPRPGVQPWQFHADAGDAQGGGAVVADQLARAS
jgi:hypothetical protein